MIEVKGLSCGYRNNIVLKDVSFTGDSGDIICILGPNGSGKSTLIKTILGLIKPFRGNILIDDENIKNWNWRKRANKISYIPQSFSSTFQYKVKDIVLMGRTPYLNIISSPSKEDMIIAEEAMEKLNILHLRDKVYSQLSGGERQLVKIAQAIAQQSEVIIMDEPTNNLDFSNQIVMLKHLKEWARNGVTVIMATHYPEHAFIYGTKALLVKDGKVVAIDNPKENLKEKELISLYNIDLKVVEIDSKGKAMKMCLPVF
ncbi:ABC transporter ATP-binding protein [Clostridium sp. Cult2]|uniref:ABC transporter ATP-binding protein n=1 Tax=Clostridium sp. Cult2 TaxID=2079003 RepID=UPI001F3BC651|nr:ABC transporter ATP-binding protein [Clostridium sp. Cult2]MCF6466156.1 iron ABC transporter ATP-binding protein [Clostridium sp. Cult2]